MAITFDLGNGVFCCVQDNSHIMHTNKGTKPAHQVVNGDYICNINGEPFVEVVAPPVAS